MSNPNPEMIELFLQEASEHLQFLREYSSILQDPYPLYEDIERLYISAHGMAGTGGTYGYTLFHEVAGKLAHIFQYAMNATISQEAAAPLVEFIYEAIALLESDLLMISANGVESADDIAAFKQRYPFAFPDASAEIARAEAAPEGATSTPLESAEEILSGPPIAAAEEASDGSCRESSEEVLESPPEPPIAAPPQEGRDDAVLGNADLGDAVPEEILAEAAMAEPLVEVLYVEPPVAAAASHHLSIDHVQPLEADEEVPEEILEFFIPEVEEHLQTITDCLLALEANPNNEDIHRLFRSMHTIKGSAAQVGWQRISTIAHRAEDLVGRLRDGELKPSAIIIDLCLETIDVLKKLIYRQWESEEAFQQAARTLIARLGYASPAEFAEQAEAETGAEAEATPALESSPLMGTEVDGEGEPLTGEVPFEQESPLVPLQAEGQPEAETEPDAAAAGTPSTPVGMGQSKSVRIALERLDRMMNAVGELVINRTRMVGRVTELEKLAEVLNFSKGRMIDKVTEFQEKYEFRRIASYGAGWDAGANEFSELEMDRYDDFGILSRSLTEISADIAEVLTQLDGFVRRVDSDINEFTKLAHRLQDEITQARMVPIGNLFTRISRTVRDASKASHKQVELTLEGAETELDNNIIQQIADPLLHLARNAVAHGIERADERYESGKPDHGNIAVRAYHRGNHIYIEVEDDGRGVDLDRVKAAALELGAISSEEAEQMDRRELLNLLFRPGFSTSPHRTELAGRGVGLDVVQTNMTNLNGEIEIETEKGFGTRFTLKVPLTLIISQALFVRCGQQTFAFPLNFVEEIRRIRADELEEVEGKLTTKVRDVVTEVVRLDETLGLPRLEPVNGYLRLVLANVGGRQVGVMVEEVLRKDEIVIKNLGEYLKNVKLFPGATIAPDGSLILLVDLNRLIMGESIERRPLTTEINASRLFAPGAEAVARGEIPAEAIDTVEREKVVVLADDSISVRKFVGRMLEKAGYRVKLACDGLEALEIATSIECDLVITDLEMPRTNGYELMMHLRQTPATSKVPVMVVTSRAGAKHRDRALKEGASAFMVKPVQEESFVAKVRELIGSSGQTVAPSPVLQ